MEVAEKAAANGVAVAATAAVQKLGYKPLQHVARSPSGFVYYLLRAKCLCARILLRNILLRIPERQVYDTRFT